jgi:hypothetical protein
MRIRLASLVVSAAFALTVGLFSARAVAYERQWHAGIGLGYGLLADDPVAHGFGGGLHLTYGLTDAFNAMVEVDLTGHPGDNLLIASGSIGVGYAFDVLQWVPYVGLMVGGYDLWSIADECGADVEGIPPCHRGRIGGSIPFGLDYQLSRSFAVGAQGRVHLLLLGDSPVMYVTAFARAEVLWGY